MPLLVGVGGDGVVVSDIISEVYIAYRAICGAEVAE
jgi:hypothetical protein